MTHPWNGSRHRSWASNTVLTLVLLIVLIAATVLSDYFGEPPNYLVGLLGTAAGAFFAAIGSDKQKKDTEVAATAERAEAKADAAVEVVQAEHVTAAEGDRATAERGRVEAEDERVEAEVERRMAEYRRRQREGEA